MTVTQWKVCVCMVGVLLILPLSGCQTLFSQPESSPSLAPTQAPSHPPAACGVILRSEVGQYGELCDRTRIVGDADDVLPAIRLASDWAEDWYVFECRVEYISSIATTINRRICGTTSDGGRQEVLAQWLVGPILVSEDGAWLVFAAARDGVPAACRSRLYKMALDGQPIALSDPSELNICQIHDLEWQYDGGGTWVRFRNWDGSVPSSDVDSMPVYRVGFESGALERIYEE